MIKIFVFDTNSLISANLLPNSVSRQAYDKARQTGILVYSDTTFTEFSEKLHHRKFEKYLSQEQRRFEISAYKKTAQLINVLTKITACRYPKDNKFLELAIESGATCIVTGDKDLLILNPFEQIPILTAAGFLEYF